MATFESIMVPTDFSSCSRQALDVAMKLADELHAKLTLLHIWDLPTIPYAGMDHVMADLVGADKGSLVEKAAREQLDAVLAEVRKRIPEAKALIRRGTPADEILNAIADEHPDLVVIGTHGRRGLSRALLGSVAERVVRSSPRPVLMIHNDRPPGKQP